MRILINGALGRMGREIGALLDREGVQHVGVDVRAQRSDGLYALLTDCAEPVDCIIDFSSHLATGDLTAYAGERKLPVVIATTGQTDREMDEIRRCAQIVPVFKTANLCLGVSLLLRLAKTASRTFPQADVEIIERHHNQKVDVPSGTALMLAEAVRSEKTEASLVVGRHENGRRAPGDIGIHSLRMGNVVGAHEAIFCMAGQQITIRHESFDRSLFAEGALTAARFLMGREPGLYSMDDVIDG